MLIFLYGQNSFSLIQYLNELAARYRKKYPDSFNFHKFDLEEDDPAEIENAVKGVSFFKQVKFVIAKNPFSKPALIEKVIKNGRAEGKDTVLLLSQSEPTEELKKKNEKFFGLLKKEAQIKEFKPPTNQAKTKFALSYLAENKVSIPKLALAKLVKESSPDLWRLKNELDKIIAFSQKNGTVTEEDTAKLINFKIDYNIFNVIDAAFSNQAKGLALFENFLADGGDPLYLISMVAFQTKNMLIVRELADQGLQYGQILKKTGFHPFLLKKNYEAVKKYSLEDLKIIFQKTADFEIALKTGQAEPRNIFFKIFL